MTNWKEQRLIDIMFNIAFTSAQYMQGKTNEDIALWVAKNLRERGFDTVQMGSSWGVLKEVPENTREMTDEQLGEFFIRTMFSSIDSYSLGRKLRHIQNEKDDLVLSQLNYLIHQIENDLESPVSLDPPGSEADQRNEIRLKIRGYVQKIQSKIIGDTDWSLQIFDANKPD